MVKNTKGGSGHKSQARKNVVSRNYTKIRLSQNEDECFGFVTSMLGDGRCRVNTLYKNNVTELLCVIRGKFRGRNKSQNFVSRGSLVLVGIRDWETPILTCDLLEIYDDEQVRIIRSNPSIDLSTLDLVHSPPSNPSAILDDLFHNDPFPLLDTSPLINNTTIHNDNSLFDNDIHLDLDLI
jgi:translation initiation factor IF-1